MPRRGILGILLPVFFIAGGGGTDGASRIATPQSAATQSKNWIEYTVSGDASVTGRDEDTVLCSYLDTGLMAHSVGEWTITLEAAEGGTGTHEAKFTVAPPVDFPGWREKDPGSDWRPTGKGTMTITDAGKDQYGSRAVAVEFSATGLESPAGHKVDVEGKLSCGVM
jgi:hypothetical protein